MDENIYDIVKANLESAFVNFKDLSAGGHAKLRNVWHFDDMPQFLHGYMAGDLHKTAFVTARTLKGSPLDDEERQRIISMANGYADKVKEIFENLKGA